MNNRVCPICDNTENIIIREIELKTYDFHPLDKNYKLVQCSNCGFMYNDTALKQVELDEYYTNQSKYDNKDVVSVGAGGITGLDKIRLSESAKIISKYIYDKDSSIIDIGCASGGLLYSLKEMGYVNLTGLDPSPICIERVSGIGNCKTILGSILDKDLKIDQKFDVIILTHVLEHILDVKKLMERLYDFLNKDGIIFIECPDSSRYHLHVHAPFQEFNTEHINHFSESTFRNLSTTMKIHIVETGLRTFKIENGLDYFAVYGVYKKTINNLAKIEKELTIDEIEKYLLISDNKLTIISDFINSLTYKNVVLYGIGQLSYKLIKITEDKQKLFFVDGDPRNQKRKIYGNVIHQPVDLPNLIDEDDSCIIISSFISSSSIKTDILRIFSVAKILPPKIFELDKLVENAI